MDLTVTGDTYAWEEYATRREWAEEFDCEFSDIRMNDETKSEVLRIPEVIAACYMD